MIAGRGGSWTPNPGEVFPGWPELFEGRPWIRLAREQPLSAVLGGGRPDDRGVSPGRALGGFEVDTRAPAITLHPAADCFRARGYEVGPLRLVRATIASPERIPAARAGGLKRARTIPRRTGRGGDRCLRLVLVGAASLHAGSVVGGHRGGSGGRVTPEAGAPRLDPTTPGSRQCGASVHRHQQFLFGTRVGVEQPPVRGEDCESLRV